jgi:O-methyltransferase involved in polyketide biosynthesis
MALPASLRWIEVDLPDILAYKEEILRDEKPVCSVERVPLDLSDRTGRRHLLEKLCNRASRALVLTEGLILYLSPEEVGALAQDLAAVPSLRHWVFDLQSPAAIRMAQKSLNPSLRASGASIRFGPDEGPLFFERYGWTPVDVRSHLKTAARLKRLPFRFRLLALLPEPKGRMGSRPCGAFA